MTPSDAALVLAAARRIRGHAWDRLAAIALTSAEHGWDDWSRARSLAARADWLEAGTLTREAWSL